jgi:hypothetical protein
MMPVAFPSRTSVLISCGSLAASIHRSDDFGG